MLELNYIGNSKIQVTCFSFLNKKTNSTGFSESKNDNNQILLLIGHTNGMMVLFNAINNKVVKHFNWDSKNGMPFKQNPIYDV